MKDYYSILGLKSSCSQSDIRRAYRAKAKDFHPDRTGEMEAPRFLALKEAYEVLISASTRQNYDFAWRSSRAKKETKWNYREFLLERKDNPESLAKLVCYDLLHDRDAEAINLCEETGSCGFFSLKSWLPREDFMDYGFLLAEAYLANGAAVKAYRILRGIAGMEEEKSWFRHFYVEILNRLTAIVRRSLPDDESNSLRMALLEDLFNLSWTAKEEAGLRKLYSELLAASGQYDKAAREAFHAWDLYPKLPGLKDTVMTLKEWGIEQSI